MSTHRRTLSDLDDRSLCLFCAQELNNSAAICFEKGLYEEATASLHNSLRLLIAVNNDGYDDTSERCCCGTCCLGNDQTCTLDGCIAFSEQTSFLIHGDNNNIATNKKRSDENRVLSEMKPSNLNVNKKSHVRNNAIDSNVSKKRRLSCSTDVSSGLPTKISEKFHSSDGYVYQRPIRVPLEGFCDCKKGYTSLLVIIVFNLSIAHHRSAMEEEGCDAPKIENISFMYKLCLELLRQAATMSSPRQPSMETIASSIRCEMIIHNNLSQLYKMSGNYASKHRQSLQDLLSKLMVLIERGTREETNNINSNWWDAARLASAQANGEALDLVEGVLKNLDPLILRRQCADAA